jgi:hypothetical protein
VKPESFHNIATHWTFPVQNHVQVRAFETVPLRKSDLITLSLNCGSQQLNDFTLVKYELVAA